MGQPDSVSERDAYRSFWAGVGRDFPTLKGAASTDYYFEGERLLFEQFFPGLAGRTLLKTDLWDEAKGTEILCWAADRGVTPIGIDIAPETVRAARSILARHRPGFVLADVRSIPLRNDSIDLVYSMGTIEHFDDYETAVAEIYRVLKPGGRAIIGVPNKLDPFLRPLLVQGLYSIGAYPYGLEKSFTPSELRRLLESVGFQTKGLSGVLFIPGWLRMLDLWLHARGSRLERLTGMLVRPFASLFRRLPGLRRHGYLIAWAVEKPRAVEPAHSRGSALRWASARDVAGIAQMSVGWLVTGLLPERWLPILGRALGAHHLDNVPERLLEF
jgi:SAM-dependent methyltransferase